MSDYVLGSDAVLDLEDIWDYIAADNVAAADRWAARLFDAFDQHRVLINTAFCRIL